MHILRKSTSSQVICTNRCAIDDMMQLRIVTSISDNSISFSKALTDYQERGWNINYCIPYQIFGFKNNLFEFNS